MLALPYEYASNMHYGGWAFSHNGQPTIVARHVCKFYVFKTDRFPFNSISNVMYKFNDYHLTIFENEDCSFRNLFLLVMLSDLI